jgi:hypothetical protein
VDVQRIESLVHESGTFIDSGKVGSIARFYRFRDLVVISSRSFSRTGFAFLGRKTNMLFAGKTHKLAMLVANFCDAGCKD